MQKKKAFLKDPKLNMSAEEKNKRLSAKLAVAPLVKRKIVHIERIDIGASGWWVHYRTGSPS